MISIFLGIFIKENFIKIKIVCMHASSVLYTDMYIKYIEL